MAKEMIALPSEFDLFKPAVLQTAIVEDYFETITAPVTGSNQVTFDIDIPASPDLFRDLSNSYLMVEGQITKSDGGSIGSTDVVAPANNVLHTLFSDISVHICGTQITDTGKHYAYRAFLETLLSTSSDVQKTRARTAGWELDTEHASVDRVIATASGSTTPNAAFVERKKLFSDGIITIAGRPHIDLFHQELDIPPGCSMQLRFTRSDDKFVLMAAENATYKFKINSLKLRVRTKKVDPGLILAHREVLKSANYRIRLNKVDVKPLSLAAGQSSYLHTNIVPGRKPRRVIVGVTSQSRVNGAYNLNPFVFGNHGLKQVYLSIGGKSIPADLHPTDFAKGNYRHEYLNLLSQLELDVGNSGLVISPEQWANTYNLYAFKLSPGSLNSGADAPAVDAPIDLHLSFASSLTEALEVLVYSEKACYLEIDQNNRATVI